MFKRFINSIFNYPSIDINFSKLVRKKKFPIYPSKEVDEIKIDSNILSETINYIKENKIEFIYIDDLYRLADLSFLKELPNLKGIKISSSFIKDISGLMYLDSLEILDSLFIHDHIIDFSRLPNLKYLNINWSKQLTNLNNCKQLIFISIYYYDNNDLQEFANLNELSTLILCKTNIKSLSGLKLLPKIAHLEIEDAKKLEFLNIHCQNRSLLKFYLWNCKKFTDYNNLPLFVNLENLDLRKTGDATDIRFIESMKKLKKVTLGFKILDGKMHYLEPIYEVGFIDFPHYTHKMKDFKQIIKD